MSIEPQYPETSTAPRPASEGAFDTRAEMNVEERADLAEDRRRQRELDDGELGGEA
jgi:hypothetical protein